jgi:menaquinone-specific isochorismate synthase
MNQQPARSPSRPTQFADLAAHTVALDAPDIDLLGVAGDDGLLFSREGAGLAARGEAFRISLPHGLAAPDAAEIVQAALSSIDVIDEVGAPGCGPVALTALPFVPTAAGELIVPSTVVGRTNDGRAWVTSIGPRGGAGARPRLEVLPSVASGSRPPDGFTLVSPMSHEDWCALVEHTVSEIRSGRFEKVVLARQIEVLANRPILVADILDRLRALYPACTVFSIEGFVGASPELLVRRTGATVSTHPLAGTVPRSGDPEADDRLAAGLLASVKDRHEHRVVIDTVAGELRPLCDSLTVPDAPSIVPLRNVSHLGTRIEGTLRQPAPSALELCARLHPTPAVAGLPRDAAIEYIGAVEGFDRGRYAGAVGWVDADGDGEFVVGIRCAELDGARARFYAGNGVVADSSPEAELAETQLKLQALLAAVVRP